MIDIGCKLALLTAALLERRLSIVYFHRVPATPDPLQPGEPDCARFRARVRWLRDGFRVLPLVEAVRRLYAGTLPPRALAITFDDGYRDNVTNALPILTELGVPATFFVTTRYLDGGMMWNDRVIEALRAWPDDDIDLRPYGLESFALRGARVAALPGLLEKLKYLPHADRERAASDLLARSGATVSGLMANADEIRRLRAAGMEVGGHTVSHPILCSLPLAEAREEIATNKAELERILGEPVVCFAYPNGRPGQDFAAEHCALLAELGYEFALTTAAGTAHPRTPRFQIPRFSPWDDSEAKYLGRLVMNYFRRAAYLDEAAA